MDSFTRFSTYLLKKLSGSHIKRQKLFREPFLPVNKGPRKYLEEKTYV